MIMSSSIFLITCFVFAILLLPNHATSITFNFTNITPQDSQDILFLDGAAYIPDDGIHLTHENNSDHNTSWSAGRATYIKPLHLWDKNSTNLVSFSTSFTFVMDSYPKRYYADGLTFFLAENNSLIVGRESLGLPFNYLTNTSIYPFVAVEFDSFGNHVGININSITSVVYQKWFNNATYGNKCKALVQYSSDLKTLGVSFISFKDNLYVWETGLNYTIDLRKVLPEWVIFGFSASTEDWNEKHIVRSWKFSSTDLKIDENKGSATTNMCRKVGLIAGPLVTVSVLAIFVSCILWRRKKHNGDKVEELTPSLEMNNEFEMGASMPRRFSYLELARSTANFVETEKLGEGGFGGVYKGFLQDLSIYVAVKRVSKTSKQGIKKYASEVTIISRLRHKNLVQLTGWCHEKGELLLVYEYMENGSLDLHLFKGKSLLTWDKRYKIAQGLASALVYLHEEWEQCVLHRDIKSSNIMLDSNFNAKLGDFGLAKLVDHEKGSQTTILAGTLGYMAPECVVTGRATKESDVFSFGVVLLEIACGRKVIDYMAEEKQVRLLEWAWELYGKGALLEAVDPSLGFEFEDEEEEEEITRLMIIGLWCVHPDSELRPSMREAIRVLNSEASVPLLPPKMPVASYLTPPESALSDFSSIGQYQSLSRNEEHLNTEYSKQTTSSTNSVSS